MNLNILYFIFLLMCLSCNKPNDNLQLVQRYKYETGRTRLEIFKEASTGRTCKKLYYQSGQLSTVLFMIDTLLDGPIVSYYENGTIEASGFYIKGKKEGAVVNYYPSGQIQSTANFKEDSMQGYFTSYFEAGAIKGVNYKEKGYTLYIKEFKRDTFGNLLSTNETYIPRIVLNSDTVHSGDTISARFELALPKEDFNLDGIFVNFAILRLPVDKNYILPEKQLYSIPLKDGLAICDFIVDVPGEKLISGYLSRKNSNTSIQYQRFEKHLLVNNLLNKN